MTRVARSLTVVLVAVATIALLARPAAADVAGFVTGGGAIGHFSFAGRVALMTDGTVKGRFDILLHPDVPDGTTVAVTCAYTKFDSLVFITGQVSFHSIGSCKALLTNGTTKSFKSDNTFGIVDNGAPGAGADTIDVNLSGPSGISVPGGPLSNGNFVIKTP